MAEPQIPGTSEAVLRDQEPGRCSPGATARKMRSPCTRPWSLRPVFRAASQARARSPRPAPGSSRSSLFPQHRPYRRAVAGRGTHHVSAATGSVQVSSESTWRILAGSSIPPHPMVRCFDWASADSDDESRHRNGREMSKLGRRPGSPGRPSRRGCTPARVRRRASARTRGSVASACSSSRTVAEQLEVRTVIFSRVTRPSSWTKEPITCDGVQAPEWWSLELLVGPGPPSRLGRSASTIPPSFRRLGTRIRTDARPISIDAARWSAGRRPARADSLKERPLGRRWRRSSHSRRHRTSPGSHVWVFRSGRSLPARLRDAARASRDERGSRIG